MSENRTNSESKEAQEEHNLGNHQETQRDHDERILRFKVRYGKPYDIPFIKETWLYSLYNSSVFRHMNKKEFMSYYSNVIDSILTNTQTLVRVSYLPDDEDIIISYSVMQHAPVANVLHFVYTKKMWRGQDAHKDLLPEFQYFTHVTDAWIKLKRKELFNPFLIGTTL